MPRYWFTAVISILIYFAFIIYFIVHGSVPADPEQPTIIKFNPEFTTDGTFTT